MKKIYRLRLPASPWLGRAGRRERRSSGDEPEREGAEGARQQAGGQREAGQLARGDRFESCHTCGRELSGRRAGIAHDLLQRALAQTVASRPLTGQPGGDRKDAADAKGPDVPDPDVQCLARDAGGDDHHQHTEATVDVLVQCAVQVDVLVDVVLEVGQHRVGRARLCRRALLSVLDEAHEEKAEDSYRKLCEHDFPRDVDVLDPERVLSGS